jgi:hypothetical protein
MTTQYFGSVEAGATEIIANNKGSKFVIAAGDNIAVSANAATATVTVSVNGVMGDELPVVQDNDTNATNYVVFNAATSGFLAPKVDSGLYYNPATGILAVTGIRFGDATIASTASEALAAANFNFKIAGDDSTQRTISLDETVQFVGVGGITVTTDAEGKVTITASRTPRVTNIASSATITPSGDTADQYNITALAVDATIDIPSGTATAGQRLTIRIKDDGTARALTWTTSGTNSYRIVGTTLPTTTVVSKVLYIGCIYNATDSFWDVVAVAQQA